MFRHVMMFKLSDKPDYDALAVMNANQMHPHHVTVLEHIPQVTETAVSVDFED